MLHEHVKSPGGAADWMRRLADHYRNMRARHPDDRLGIVFDIDGTIIDTRHLVRRVLLEYDRLTGTDHFRSLRIADVTEHEDDIEPLLGRWVPDPEERARVLAFYRREIWSPESTRSANQPYRGVMELVRWFQLQPDTVVVLNTGRPEALRQPTLDALQGIAEEYRVRFPSEDLLMSQRPQGVGVAIGKVEALAELDRRGVRVVAVIDNEPENLAAMADADTDLVADVLFLHASTFFLTTARPQTPPPTQTATGDTYDLSHFLSTEDLVDPALGTTDPTGHVTLVSGRIDSEDRLNAALAEPITWLEVPVGADPYGRVGSSSASKEDAGFDATEALGAISRAGRSIRVEIGDAEVIDQLSTMLQQIGFTEDRVWFSGPLDVLGSTGISALRCWWPTSVISIPVDFLAPLIIAAPESARPVLDLLGSWGIGRFSIRWDERASRVLLSCLERWGYEVDINDVPDRTSAIEAAVLLPASVTCEALVSTSPSMPSQQLRTGPASANS